MIITELLVTFESLSDVLLLIGFNGFPATHQVIFGVGLEPVTSQMAVTPIPADIGPSIPKMLMDIGGTGSKNYNYVFIVPRIII